jgi:CBS domain-containing protein
MSTPSTSLLSHLRVELQAHAPFAQMPPADVERFLAGAAQAYFAPGETILSPEQGPVQQLFFVRQGEVSAQRGIAEATGGLHFEPGECFPVGALMGARAVTATYTSQGDTFCLLLPAAEVHALARASAPFADFLNRRVLQFLALSRRALQVAYASQSLAEQSMETPLARLASNSVIGVAPQTPLREALQLMHERHVGSVLVLDPGGAPLGILTRHDVLARITLAQRALSTPISELMSAPVLCLSGSDTAQDAALLMSRHGLRHVPVLDGQRVMGMVSERDLFTMQRLSLKQVSAAIREAGDVDTLRVVAQDIRRFARHLLGQGVAARQLTELISHLNDVLTQRLVRLLADDHGLDLGRACWLAFGSEGRGEQTIATDQDNGLVFESDDPPTDRPRWLALARAVNAALDSCGYPLCQGQVMAGNPACCLSQQEWLEAFSDWMEHGAPEDLLKASIFFDFRPLAGALRLAEPLRRLVGDHAVRLPRFMRQMAENALRRRVPLNWLGAIEAHPIDGRDGVDLKLGGTAVFVDVARLYALAHGVAETGTRARLEAMGRRLQLPVQESEGWIGAFEFLQMLRLRVQMEDGADAAGPNWIALDRLNDIDRRVLKESFKLARRLQQRLELDYLR